MIEHPKGILGKNVLTVLEDAAVANSAQSWLLKKNKVSILSSLNP